MPHKVWAVGEEVLAPDFNTYVQQQVVEQFPTVAARASAISTPIDGQASYLNTGDAVEGIEFWNGVSWRKPWNMPWGLLNAVQKFSDTTGMGTAITDIPGMSVTASANVTGRRVLRITAWLLSVAPGGGSFYLQDAANNPLTQGSIAGQSGVGQIVHLMAYYVVPQPTSSLTFKVRAASSTGTLNVLGASAYPATMLIEDLGPTTGTPT